MIVFDLLKFYDGLCVFVIGGVLGIGFEIVDVFVECGVCVYVCDVL